MSECIIIYRNTSNQRVDFIQFDERGELAVFKDREEAEKAATQVPVLRAGMPYQILELDEL